jgi:hypothetical protein
MEALWQEAKELVDRKQEFPVVGITFDKLCA